MNIERKNLNKVKKLIDELEKLEGAIDITKNYDASITASFFTIHNFNTKTPKRVDISIPAEIKKAIIDSIQERIKEIKEELEKL